MAISPDEKLIAFASVKGTVCVLQRAETSTGTRCLNRSVEHDGAAVTALCWVQHSDQVFVGDSQGRLSVINVSLFMVSSFILTNITALHSSSRLNWNFFTKYLNISMIAFENCIDNLHNHGMNGILVNPPAFQ